ncbi:MAG: hypothetical protein V4649_09060 [Bacteroidota bacterium]
MPLKKAVIPGATDAGSVADNHSSLPDQPGLTIPLYIEGSEPSPSVSSQPFQGFGGGETAGGGATSSWNIYGNQHNNYGDHSSGWDNSGSYESGNSWSTDSGPSDSSSAASGDW